VLAFFRVNPAKLFESTRFLLSGALVLINRRVNLGEPGETGTGGGALNKSKNRRVFFSRYLAANDGSDKGL